MNNRKPANSILAIAIVAVVVLALALVGICSRLFSSEKAPKDAPSLPETEEQEFLADDTGSEGLSLDTMDKFSRFVLDRLSLADYKGLDDYLLREYEKQKEQEEQATRTDVSYSSVIDMYRADLTMINSLYDSETGSENLQGYFYPETLASAFIYSPISKKVDAVMYGGALVLPGIPAERTAETRLTRVDYEGEEKTTEYARIRNLLAGYELRGFEQYTYYAFSTEWRITMVCLDSYLWYVGTVECLDESSQESFLSKDQLIQLRNELAASGQKIDFDSLIHVAG